MRRKEAYVRLNALMTQLASTSSSPNASLSAGRPANSAFKLYESRALAVQNMAKRRYRRALDIWARGVEAEYFSLVGSRGGVCEISWSGMAASEEAVAVIGLSMNADADDPR